MTRLPGVDTAKLHRADVAYVTRAVPTASAKRGPLGYDPLEALNLDAIQKSIELDDAERSALATVGFVIVEHPRLYSFGDGYARLYGEHLPLFVTLDSVLESVHRSYADMLAAIETDVLAPELGRLLDGMRDRLDSAADLALSDENRVDLELYLAIASSLLRGANVAPRYGLRREDVEAFVNGAVATRGTSHVALFGVEREEDFSQFTPRGHYNDSETLQRYFRAMMWLGRVDFRVMESDEAGVLLFRRRQLEAAIAFWSLLDDAGRERWRRIDELLGALFGDSDSPRLSEIPKLLAALDVADLRALASRSDQRIAQTIVDGGFGAQRIASYLMRSERPDTTLPLHRSVAPFGQRYAIDSHVFSNLVFDRLLPRDDAERRLMPNPLDIAYAALGNDQAASLLRDELRAFKYAPELANMRALVDAHDSAYWDSSLYTLWLSSLRGMSQPALLTREQGSALPRVMGSEAWGRRVLSAQLASWAELRHDTVLYVKQSYTSGVKCEFPDAYVDPYPEAWGALVRFAQRGRALALNDVRPNAPALATRLVAYFEELERVTRTLREMSEREIAGLAFTAEQLAFIQETVVREPGCGSTSLSGWYGRLHLSAQRAAQYDPIVADVHTQPQDAEGVEVGRVLHVGVGRPRLMVVAVDTCRGVRAYAGLVSSYFEHITEHYERLDDQKWLRLLHRNEVEDVPWMRSILPQRRKAGAAPAAAPP